MPQSSDDAERRATLDRFNINLHAWKQMFNRRPKLGLQNCHQQGVDSRAELFIVEGDSASQSVCSLRDPDFQAVLPMQGKPANALKASARLLRENVLFGELRDALGYGAADNDTEENGTSHEDSTSKELHTTENSKTPAPVDPARCRYSRILLLFDPDADGIHGGALMLIYFYQQFPALLSAGRIEVIRSPLFELSYSETAHPDAPRRSQLAYTEEQFQQLQRELKLAGAIRLKTLRMRGLGGMPAELLRTTCIDPATRTAFRLGIADAQAAIAIFGGSQS